MGAGWSRRWGCGMTGGGIVRSAWVLLVWLVMAGAAALAAPPKTLRFEHLGVDQGLAQESATAIVQDRSGFIWIGSQAGLARFDGYTAVVYRNRPDDDSSLSDNYVTVLRADDDGWLWVGTRSGGVLRFDPRRGTFRRFAPADSARRGFGDQQVHAIITAPAGAGGAGRVRGHAVWIATEDGLERLDTGNGRFNLWHHDAADARSLASDSVRALALDRSGRLWVGTARGLDRLRKDGRGFDHVQLLSGPGGTGEPIEVTALHLDHEDRLWVGTATGLLTLPTAAGADAGHVFTPAEGVPPGRIQAILSDDDGALWIGTATAGLLRGVDRNQRFLAYRHEAADRRSVADDNIDSLFQDRTGTLWVGTHTNGISTIDLASGGFERYAGLGGDMGSNAGDKIYSVASDRAGRIWLGTVGGGLLRLERGSGAVVAFRHRDDDPGSLPSDFVRAVHIDDEGRIWVGTDAGLATLDPSSGTFRPRSLDAAHPASRKIRQIVRRRDGGLWVGTEAGVYRYDPASGAIRAFRHDPRDPASLGQNTAWALLEDRAGTLWVGTDVGLNRLDARTGRFSHYRHDPGRPDSLVHDRITYLHEDRAGRLWIGTSGGLDRLEHGADGRLHFRGYTQADGLPADAIGAILEDRAGRLWISSTAGISRFDPGTGRFRNYSARDGLIDGSYYIGSAFAAADGTFYFGGNAGLTVFQPGEIHDNRFPPQVVITALQVFNRPVDPWHPPAGVRLDGPIETARTLQLAPSESVFSLEFAALHYADPVRNRYAYRLVGFDKDWVSTDASRRFVTYTNLDPGRYTFRVKAANKDGVWNETGVSLAISIAPPFWATWWFRTLAVAGLLAALYAVIRFRERGLTRQRQLLEEQVRNRTAEVVEQKEAIERSHATLSVLGEIGRQVTATLDEADVCHTLHRHVRELLPSESFTLYRLDGASLVSVLSVEDGRELPVERIALSDATRHAARCARERVDLAVDQAPEESDPSHVAGTLITLSALFAPLVSGERLLGVMTTQCARRNAYGERERLVFRTLCAYGAIALDNASAYRHLADTDASLQALLREQQAIYDNAAAAIFIIKDRVVHRCNRTMEEMLSYGPGELLGRSTRVYAIDDKAWEAHAQVVYPRLEAGEVAEGEIELKRKNGDRFWASFRCRALDPGHVSQGSIWVASDISERKRSETALLDAKQRLEHSLREVEQINRHVTLLGEMIGFLQATPTAAEAFACIAEFGPRLFADSSGTLFLLDGDGRVWVEQARWGRPVSEPETFLADECWALRRSRPYRVDAPAEALACAHVAAGAGARRPWVCLPLTAQGKTFGVLTIEHQHAESAVESERRFGLAVAMAEQVALAIANVQLREALLQQSIRDPLTGLYNRRYLQEVLFREIAHSRRTHACFAVLMIDVDHFKKFNDTFGHQAGDLVLQKVAQAILTRFRRSDVACRFGGEEFTILLPDTELELAQRLANDLLDSIRALELSHDERALDRVTASLGVAIFPAHGATPPALIAAADAALYRAKQSGRNRVVVANARGAGSG